MRELFIGLISGTSADGIDAVLVDFSDENTKLLHTYFEKFNPEIRQRIQAFAQPRHDEINELGALDILLGKTFAEAALNLLKETNTTPQEIRAIGSHGQTLRHAPQQRFTLQAGDPNIIASQTGITTIADFRRRDLSLGGQGAPLVPGFHNVFFKNREQDQCILNIGGIANVTFLPKNPLQKIVGFDTGPGNTLMDAWIQQHQGVPYDAKGNWARIGTVDQALLTQLLKDAYLMVAPPKSTGPEYFNLDWLRNFLNSKISPVDVQTTLLEFTSQSILAAVEQHFSRCQLIVCGGGAHNTFLLERLTALARNHTVSTTESFGLHPDWVEATAFAWLAKQTLAGKPGNLKDVTGAMQETILGGVYFK